jgi:hypothetical protein
VVREHEDKGQGAKRAQSVFQEGPKASENEQDRDVLGPQHDEAAWKDEGGADGQQGPESGQGNGESSGEEEDPRRDHGTGDDGSPLDALGWILGPGKGDEDPMPKQVMVGEISPQNRKRQRVNRSKEPVPRHHIGEAKVIIAIGT